MHMAWAGGDSTGCAALRPPQRQQTGCQRSREGGPHAGEGWAGGIARPRLRHTGHVWVSDKGSGIGQPRVQMPASVLCDLEDLLGLSVPQLLHPGKELMNASAPLRGSGRVRGAHAAALRP